MNLISKELTDGTIIYGDFIEPTPFCIKHAEDERCRRFHREGIFGEGFRKCPYGMSVYTVEDGTVYFSMREKSTYNKRNTKHNGTKGQNDREIAYNPVIDGNKLRLLISTDNEEQNRHRSIIHEVKQLNAQIKEISDNLIQRLASDNEECELSQEDTRMLFDGLRTIFVSSSMVSGRYLLSDYDSDRARLSKGDTFPCNVYKKFDKIRRIFKNYLHKGVSISILGNSFMQLDAYSSFEMIPMLLVENAIKYSYDSNSTVEIVFDEKNKDSGELIVLVNSIGPYCTQTDIARMFDRYYRGENAKKVEDGSGIGMYFAKILCDIHGIDINVSSDEKSMVTVSGIEYAPYQVKLSFHNMYSP